MDQLIPTLASLVEPFRDCFHPQVFQTFQALLAGWIVCQGPRTISEVWLATGWAAKRHHDTAYAVFHGHGGRTLRAARRIFCERAHFAS
jgi:hypothetical protein